MTGARLARGSGCPVPTAVCPTSATTRCPDLFGTAAPNRQLTSPSIRRLHGGRFLYGECDLAPESDAAGRALGRADRATAQRARGSHCSGAGAPRRAASRHGERRPSLKVGRFSHRRRNGVEAGDFSRKCYAQAAAGVSALSERVLRYSSNCIKPALGASSTPCPVLKRRELE